MKYLKIFIIIILTFFLFNINCYAIDNTFERSPEKPLVPDRVVVDEGNIGEILATPAVDASIKIYDFIGLFSDVEKSELSKKMVGYVGNTNFDVSVVFTKDLSIFSLSEYAENFYEYNYFEDNGIIMIVYLGYKEPQIYIKKYGNEDNKLFKIYNDEIIKQLTKYIYKEVSAGEYKVAVSNYIKLLDDFYNLDDDNRNYIINDKGELTKKIPWFLLVIISIIVGVILDVIFVFKFKKNNNIGNKNIYDSCLDIDTLTVKFNHDNLISTDLVEKK